MKKFVDYLEEAKSWISEGKSQIVTFKDEEKPDGGGVKSIKNVNTKDFAPSLEETKKFFSKPKWKNIYYVYELGFELGEFSGSENLNSDVREKLKSFSEKLLKFEIEDRDANKERRKEINLAVEKLKNEAIKYISKLKNN